MLTLGGGEVDSLKREQGDAAAAHQARDASAKKQLADSKAESSTREADTVPNFSNFSTLGLSNVVMGEADGGAAAGGGAAEAAAAGGVG